jgi:hypothetical protein
MTPGDLAGIAALNGLSLIALTDHNTARNCPAAAKAAAVYGIGFIPGMEVTTSEDIHAICLFQSLNDALAFDRFIYERLPDIKNRPAVFGDQLICDVDGNVTGSEPRLLITAAAISINDLPVFARKYNGLCYPAHVDRESNGLLAILGRWPRELDVPAAEVRYEPTSAIPPGLKIIRASDAHRLCDIFSSNDCNLPLESPNYEGLSSWLFSR